MFRTSNTEIVRNCQSYFNFNLPSELWSRRVKRFDVKYATCGGSFVNYWYQYRKDVWHLSSSDLCFYHCIDAISICDE